MREEGKDETHMSCVLAVSIANAVILLLSQYAILPLRFAVDWFLQSVR